MPGKATSGKERGELASPVPSPAEPDPDSKAPAPAGVYAGPTESEELWSVLSYMGAIFLGPFAPLCVYLAKRGSQFTRLHATQSLNVALTCTLFGVSGVIVGGLLALDSPDAALVVMLPLAVAGWLVMLTQLIRGAVAASRGSYRELPRWICSPLIR